MSSLTDFLKLFKWDTKTDGSQKFNIDKALNENIDKIEANAVEVNQALSAKMNLHRDTKALTAKGWYRVAEFIRTGIYIVNITQRWNEKRPSSCLLLVNVGAQNFNISILDAEFINSSTIGISQVRLVKDVDSASASAFLEIYYNYNVSNNITVQIINESIDTNVNTIHFTETTSEDIFIKATKDMRILHLDDAINTNKTAIGTLSSLKTTDKTSLVNALNELRFQTRNNVNGSSIEDCEDPTFDAIMGLSYPTIYTVNGNDNTFNGAGFPVDGEGNKAYKYGLLITYRSYADYAKTQIYICDGKNGLWWRTRVGGSWNHIKQQRITTGTEFATDEYIDNKRVYRKRVNCGALPNATAKSVAHGLSNVTFVKPPQGLAKNSNGTVLTLPYSAPNGTEYSVALSVNNANIQISAGNDRSAYTECYVDLYYTKN